MNISLFFPPGTDPRAPYLALPCLAATLRKAGIETSLYDLDVGGVHALLDSQNLASAGHQVRKMATSRDMAHWRLAQLSQEMPARAAHALAVLRDERFYDPNQYCAARSAIYDALDLVSAAQSGAVHYGISPIRYDVDGIDVQKLSDLKQVTQSDGSNLFADYWQRCIFPQLAQSPPDIAGIAINNRQQIIPGLLLARRLKEQKHFVVIGGAFFTKFVSKLAHLPEFFELFADGVIAYEGETALVELAGALQSGRDYSRVPNYLYVDRGQVKVNRTHVENVAELPCPDFTGLPLDKYLAPSIVLPIFLGKGCYFNRCKFCDIPYINHISKKAYRLRETDQIVSHILELRERFGCRHFEITDEALPPRTLEHLADALEPYQHENFCFVGYGRLEPAFTADTCRKIARMGMKKLFFGLESGSQEILDDMDKGIKVAEVPAILKNCRDAGISFHIFSIIGFPRESEQASRETFAFFERNAALLDHPGNSFDIHPFGLEMRTAYFAEASALGIMISPAALAKDFVIGVGQEWFNMWGITHGEVERLANDYNAGLRQIFSASHNYAEHLWPAFEEYSVLYADYYAGRPFPYRSGLPDETSPARYRLRWSPSIVFTKSGNKIEVQSRSGQAEIEPDAVKWVGSSGYHGVREILNELERHSRQDRESVRLLLGQWTANGFLQIEPQ